MLRTVVLIALNLIFSVVLALSLVPLAIFAIPAIRNQPAAGQAVLVFLIAALFAMNIAFWRRWKR